MLNCQFYCIIRIHTPLAEMDLRLVIWKLAVAKGLQSPCTPDDKHRPPGSPTRRAPQYISQGLSVILWRTEGTRDEEVQRRDDADA